MISLTTFILNSAFCTGIKMMWEFDQRHYDSHDKIESKIMKVCAKLSMWTRNKWVDNKHIRDFLYCFLASHPITAASSTALGLLTLDFFPILFCTNHSSTPHEIFSVETESNSVTTVNLFVSQVFARSLAWAIECEKILGQFGLLFLVHYKIFGG